jgi:hypothetical protein
MYQILDELDMWSLVKKNPKEIGVLEKHNTKNTELGNHALGGINMHLSS